MLFEKNVILWCFNVFIRQQNFLYFWFILIITWQFSWSSFKVHYEFPYKPKYPHNCCEPSTIWTQKIVWKWVAMSNFIWNITGLMNNFFTVLIWFIYQVCIHLSHMCFQITVLMLQNYDTWEYSLFVMLIGLYFIVLFDQLIFLVFLHPVITIYPSWILINQAQIIVSSRSKISNHILARYKHPF